jgi:sugar/nucleoside kinase (ribokinase family)
MKLLNNIKKSNCEILFNPGAANITSDEMFQFIKKFVDVLILNYQESCALTNETDISRIIEKIRNFCDCSIITMGKMGSLAIENNEVFYQDCEPIKVFDTTGAGDSFMAGFTVSKIRGYYLQESIKFSNDVAKKFLVQKNKRYL